MKIYAHSEGLDLEQLMPKLVGKDIWIRVYSKYDEAELYIHVLSETDTAVIYNRLPTTYIDAPGWFRLTDWEYYMTRSSKQDSYDFYWDFSLVPPVEFFTTEEIKEIASQGVHYEDI